MCSVVYMLLTFGFVTKVKVGLA